MNMMPSALVAQAKLLRLDVFASPPAHCDGSRLQAGAGMPLASATFKPGDPIRITVAPGHRVVLLTAFADSAGTVVLGTGCSEQDIAAGALDCIDLQVVAPDGGAPDAAPRDLAMRDSANMDLSNMDSANPDLSTPDIAMPDLSTPDFANPDLSTPDLSNPDLSSPDLSTPDIVMPDLSTPDIAMPDLSTPDFAMPDLSTPDFAMPDLSIPDFATPDLTNCNGNICAMAQTCCSGQCVDTSVNVANCGSCGFACSQMNAMPVCMNGICGWMCAPGFSHCGNGNIGCECATPGCCNGACQTTHNDGLGQHYYDCNPLGTPGMGNTYSQMMAMEAANAWMAGGTTATVMCMGQTCFHKKIGGQCATWCYTGALAGRVDLAGGCACPTVNSPTWN